MKIIAGLGNPGFQYQTTRHNVGFLAVDRLIDSWNASGPTQKNQGEVFTVQVGGEKVLLVKPQTYMNLSGRCLGPLFQFYQLEPEDLIVIHDDLDLPPLSLRFKTGGGSGGHNGLKSIDEALGKARTGYHRIRIGIGSPRQNLDRPNVPVVDYVLHPFSNDELDRLDGVLDNVVDAASEILRGRIQVVMNRLHGKKGNQGESKD